MNKTLQLLKPLIIEETSKLSLEDLAQAYQANLNPCLLADAFNRTYKLAVSVSNNYYGLNEEDIESLSLIILDQCLQSYRELGAKFSTFYVKILSNKFREETEALSTQKRKANINSQSFEDLMEKGYEVASPVETQPWLLLESLKAYDLSEREMTYCELLLEDYCNKEIAEIMQISVMTLCNLRKSLRSKIDPNILQIGG